MISFRVSMVGLARTAVVLLAALAFACGSARGPKPAAAPPARALTSPVDHTEARKGVLHKSGAKQAMQNCVQCHGGELQGSAGPSCYQCHKRKWR